MSEQNEIEINNDSQVFQSDTGTESSEDTNTAEESSVLPSDTTDISDGKPFHTLRVSSLYKSFGKKKVVQGVDFKMHTGEVLGLLGPNGAGKTTSFYMIVGFYKPTSGEIFLDNKRITPLPMYKRAQLGISYLPQEPSVFKKLTVEENIWSILETRPDLTRAEKKQKRLALSISPVYTIHHFVTPAGFKPTTFGTGIRRSIQLNYGACRS